MVPLVTSYGMDVLWHVIRKNENVGTVGIFLVVPVGISTSNVLHVRLDILVSNDIYVFGVIVHILVGMDIHVVRKVRNRGVPVLDVTDIVLTKVSVDFL